jgi:acyl carrier protein
MKSPAATSYAKILSVVNEILGDAGLAPVACFEPGIRLREDLGFDSLKLAILTVRLEDLFQVDVFSSGIVSTLGEVAAKLPKPAE